MSKKLSKLLRQISKIEANAGLNKQQVHNILQGLGQIQALVDSFENGQSDSMFQHQFRKIQTQLGLSDLDEQTIYNIMKTLSQLNTQIESMIQTHVEKSGMDERSIFNYLRRVSQNNDQVRSKDFEQLVSKILKKIS